MAESLSFDTGLKEYDINGVATVRFNPSDANFVERLYSAFTELDKRQDEFEQRVKEIGDDGEKMFAYARERDTEMRETIDDVFGQPGLSDLLFADMNCYALAPDGTPVWIGLFMAVVSVVDKAFRSGKAANDPRVLEYNKKHAELLEKYRAATTKH